MPLNLAVDKLFQIKLLLPPVVDSFIDALILLLKLVFFFQMTQS